MGLSLTRESAKQAASQTLVSGFQGSSKGSDLDCCDRDIFKTSPSSCKSKLYKDNMNGSLQNPTAGMPGDYFTLII